MTKQPDPIDALAAEFEALTSAARVEAFRRVAGARYWGIDSLVWRKTWKSWFQSDYTPAQNPFAEEAHDAYFDQFEGFATNPRAGLIQQFAYLAVHQKWEIGGEKWKREQGKLFGGVSESAQRSSVNRVKEPQAPQKVNAYFAKFEDFTADPGATLEQQFRQLARHQGWKIGTKIWMQERAKLFKEESKSVQASVAKEPHDAYFDTFEGFTTDWRATLHQQFRHLAEHQGWKPGSRVWLKEHAKLFKDDLKSPQTPIVKEPHNAYFDTFEGFTTNWRSTLHQQFRDLAEHQGWKPASKVWMQERAKLFKEEFKNPQTPIAQGPRDAYFNQFKNFTPDPSNTLSYEFRRLAEQQGWSKEVRKRERAKLYDAEFADVFGRKGTLKEWQKFCKSIGIAVGVDSIPECKEALRKVYFNIVNVLEHERDPDIPLIRFKDREAFLDYTRGDKIFPLEDAIENPFLEQLLRKLRRFPSARPPSDLASVFIKPANTASSVPLA